MFPSSFDEISTLAPGNRLCCHLNRKQPAMMVNMIPSYTFPNNFCNSPNVTLQPTLIWKSYTFHTHSSAVDYLKHRDTTLSHNRFCSHLPSIPSENWSKQVHLAWIIVIHMGLCVSGSAFICLQTVFNQMIVTPQIYSTVSADHLLTKTQLLDYVKAVTHSE